MGTKGRFITCFSNWTGIGWVWVSLVLTEVLRNVVTSQLCHNVGDVAKWTQVLQTFVSSTCGASKFIYIRFMQACQTDNTL
jgi:hypothetical protein